MLVTFHEGKFTTPWSNFGPRLGCVNSPAQSDFGVSHDMGPHTPKLQSDIRCHSLTKGLATDSQNLICNWFIC